MRPDDLPYDYVWEIHYVAVDCLIGEGTMRDRLVSAGLSLLRLHMTNPPFINREEQTRWQDPRRDVRDATTAQHRTSLNHVNRLLGDRQHDAITGEDVQRMIIVLAGEKRARESIRKARTALAMVLDFAGALRTRPATSG